MGCDLCGRDEDLVNAIVEGSIVNVCQNCSEYGDVIEIKKSNPKRIIKKESKYYLKEEPLKFVVENYSEEVKKQRIRKNLTQDELARNIAEKTTVIQKIESGQFAPTVKIAKKLEQFFGIKLIDESLDEIQNIEAFKETEEDVNFKDQALTIGDILKDKEDDE